jgi:hypothetical protein
MSYSLGQKIDNDNQEEEKEEEKKQFDSSSLASVHKKAYFMVSTNCEK